MPHETIMRMRENSCKALRAAPGTCQALSAYGYHKLSGSCPSQGWLGGHGVEQW